MPNSSQFANAVNSALSLIGLRVVRSKGRNFDNVIEDVINLTYPSKQSALTIFDVGANNGSSILRFKRIFNDRNLLIYSFEPAASLFDELNLVYKDDKQVKIFNLAVGSQKSKIDFHYHPTSIGSSSVLAHKEDTNFSRRRNLDGNIQTYNVDCISLDSFVKEKMIN